MCDVGTLGQLLLEDAEDIVAHRQQALPVISWWGGQGGEGGRKGGLVRQAGRKTTFTTSTTTRGNTRVI